MAKVLMILNSGWNAVNFRSNLLKRLIQKNHRVIVLCPSDEYIMELKKIGATHISLNIDRTSVNIFKEIRTFVNIFFSIKNNNPDIILLFTIKANVYGSLAARLLKKPYINNITGLGTTFLTSTWMKMFTIFLYKLSLYKSHKIFFQNEDDQNLFIKNKIAERYKSETIPGSGIDIKKFRMSKGKLMKQKIKPFRFILLSRLIWEKGIFEFVQAASYILDKNTNVEFEILGSLEKGNPRAVPEKLLLSWIKGKKIKYLGFKTDIRQYILNSDCVVHPSYREGTSRTLLEAAALGKPIIASNVPGCRNIVRHNYNGYLTKKKDKDELALFMEKMLKLEPSKREMMGLRGRKLVEKKFDEEIVIGAYFDTIVQALNKSIKL